MHIIILDEGVEGGRIPGLDPWIMGTEYLVSVLFLAPMTATSNSGARIQASGQRVNEAISLAE